MTHNCIGDIHQLIIDTFLEGLDRLPLDMKAKQSPNGLCLAILRLTKTNSSRLQHPLRFDLNTPAQTHRLCLDPSMSQSL